MRPIYCITMTYSQETFECANTQQALFAQWHHLHQAVWACAAAHVHSSMKHEAAYLLVTVAADKTCSNAAAAAWQSASFPFSMATNAGMVPHAHASLCNAAKVACQSTQGSHSAKASRQHDIHAAMHWQSSRVMTDQIRPPAQCHCPLL